MTGPFRETAVSPIDDAIGSIRVASTLIALFETLVYRDESSIEELELRIQQSQEIYPSIWQHLDDARRVLAAGNRDVAAYDEIRAQGSGHVGVTDVDVSSRLEISPTLGGLRVHYSTTKSAAFNVAGLARASNAATVLMRCLPEVDWAGLARAENREIAAAGSMRQARYRTIAKVVAAMLGVLVITIVVRKLAMSTTPAEPERSAPRPTDIAAANQREEARVRLAKLEDSTRSYRLTCDPTLRPELVRMLRDAGRPEAAAKVETTACVRELASCSTLGPTLIARLTARYGFEGRVGDFSCRGIVIADPAGRPEAAFAVSITGRVHGAEKTFRGVTSTTGADVVAFELAPVAYSVGVGDLDGDHRDELVAVGGSRLVVTRIEGGHFVDLDGPALPEGCEADVTVESSDDETVLVIAARAPRPRGCPAERQEYRLVGAALQLVAARSP